MQEKPLEYTGPDQEMDFNMCAQVTTAIWVTSNRHVSSDLWLKFNNTGDLPLSPCADSTSKPGGHTLLANQGPHS